ncbi:unnamed protein product [Amoebophrya sp. A25]|nr:unnamed protein product [Amoebophrya sp. A25]|eukprot:GSA25T00004630001.1
MSTAYKCGPAATCVYLSEEGRGECFCLVQTYRRTSLQID